MKSYFTVMLLLILCADAHAYIGPGLGVGTIGAILGVIASVFIALYALLWFPVKRLLKRAFKKPEQTEKKE